MRPAAPTNKLPVSRELEFAAGLDIAGDIEEPFGVSGELDAHAAGGGGFWPIVAAVAQAY